MYPMYSESVSAKLKLKCPVRAKLKCPTYPSESEIREEEIGFGNDELQFPMFVLRFRFLRFPIIGELH
jgi:hypothetical protein